MSKELDIQVLKAKNAFVAGALDSWAIIIEECPEMIPSIIKQMREMSKSLKKSAGVVIFDDATK